MTSRAIDWVPGATSSHTQGLREIIWSAQAEAVASGTAVISTGHLLVTLLRKPCPAQRMIEGCGCSAADISRVASDRLALGIAVTPLKRRRRKLRFTNSAFVALHRACELRTDLGTSYTGTEHLLLALAERVDPVTTQLFAQFDLSSDRLLEAYRKTR